jgi:hypothetical protein
LVPLSFDDMVKGLPKGSENRVASDEHPLNQVAAADMAKILIASRQCPGDRCLNISGPSTLRGLDAAHQIRSGLRDGLR